MNEVLEVMPSTDEQYLHRALRLAMTARGRAEPNPMVGCVVVKSDRVIGEGFHTHFGGPHAEPTALANCTESPAGATAYVTLEPCCHTNKKTPPCAPRLIAAKIARVVIGCLDPNPVVNGNGIRMLREAGIHVDGPLLEPECRQLIAPFLARVNFNRPYVTVKWAETADGKIAGSGGVRLRITNDLSTRIVHQLRGRCDAIAVGIGTVLSDDPELTVRGVEAMRVPHRVVLDGRLRIPLDSKLVRTAGEFPTSVCCRDASSEGASALSDRGMNVIQVAVEDSGRLSLAAVLEQLPKAAHVLVEAGPALAASFFAANLADRLWVFRSPESINDASAPAAAPIPSQFVKTAEAEFDRDVLSEYLNVKSSVFAAAVESADLREARQPED
jgi:diaminohydroxyphosphoribosylaminopyrimidine deaminase/5-amino-6-(5-phosphoribosylamino)uracil reductase